MPSIDLSLPELERYRSQVVAPADFDERWDQTLSAARQVPMAPKVERVETGLSLVDVFDVTFPGFAGDPVKAWLTVPAGAKGPLPTLVTYQGYGGGRGLPTEHLTWACAGYAQLFMDTRGQGASWGSGGHTADPHGSGPSVPGVMLSGIESFEDYYYRRLITDAVRAVDAARALPQVDVDRIVVSGISQGGGLTIAAAALADGVVAAMPDVPFLCDIPRGVQVSPTNPYQEIARYLSVHRDRVDDVFGVLAYVDGVNFASRADVPALFSVGLLDTCCPPSTVYGAYHAWAGPKSIEVYHFNNHEGGQEHQVARQLAWLSERLGAADLRR